MIQLFDFFKLNKVTIDIMFKNKLYQEHNFRGRNQLDPKLTTKSFISILKFYDRSVFSLILWQIVIDILCTVAQVDLHLNAFSFNRLAA